MAVSTPPKSPIQFSHPHLVSVPDITSHPVVVPPIPPHHNWNDHTQHHPTFFSWAGIWDAIRYGLFNYGGHAAVGTYCYGHYKLDPDDGNCVPSAWYYYPNLPPYIQDDQMQTDTTAQPVPTPLPDLSAAYPPDWKPDLDHALADLKTAWEHEDENAMTRLLPIDGDVTVTVEGQDSYKLSAKEFDELFRDGIENTQTLAYGVVEANKLDDGEIEVTAKHEFDDPWGQMRTIEHTYILQLGDKGYVIREFHSSSYR